MRNFTSKLIGEVGLRILSSSFIFLLAHKIGAAQFGLYSTAVAFATLFVILVDLGTNAIVTREIARDIPHRSRILKTSNFLKILAAASVIILIHVVSYASSFARENQKLVDSIGVIVIVYSLMDHAAALLAGRNELGWEAFLKISCRAVVIGTGIGVLFVKPSLLAVTMSMAAASGVAIVMGTWILRSRFGEFGAAVDAEALRKLVRSSLPLLGFTSFWMFYDNQDILLLHHFQIANRDIGLYWSASKIIDVLRVFPVLLMGAFFPTLARLAATRESYLQTSRTLLGYAVLAIPAVVGSVYWAAPFLETLFYGPQFLEAAVLLRLLLPAFAATFLNHIFMQMLITKDLEMKLLSASLVACVSNFILNWFLIPRYGPPGVCYALIISEWIFLSFQIRWIVVTVPGLFNPFRRRFG